MAVIDITGVGHEGGDLRRAKQKEDRVRARLKFRDGAMGITLPGGNVSRSMADADGYFEVVMYRSDFEDVKRHKVEDRPELIAAAVDAFWRDMHDHIRQSIRNAARKDMPRSESAFTPDEKKAASTYYQAGGLTWHAIFAGLAKRSPRALASIEAVEELPKLETIEEERARLTTQAAVKTAAEVRPSQDVSALIAQMEAMKAEIASLKAKK